MPNQIRLTVLGPRSGTSQRGRECDVLVTAPAGTVLATVTGGLSAALASAAGPSGVEGAASGHPAGGPGGAEPVAVYVGATRLDPQRQIIGEPPLVDGATLSLHGPVRDPASPTPDSLRLEAVAGPDAGGVHLLHGGQIRIGRSTEADVVLDDPDVSRLHCVVAVAPTGTVTVADLGSTNGTTVDGRPVDGQPQPLAPGAVLRVGESDLWVRSGALRAAVSSSASAVEQPEAAPSGATTHGAGLLGDHPEPGTHGSHGGPDAPPPPAGPPPVPGQRRGRAGIGSWGRRRSGREPGQVPRQTPRARSEPRPDFAPPPREVPPGEVPPAGPRSAPESGRWPDPAELLLTALDAGHRRWERGPDHPDALSVRLGTTRYGSRPAVPVTVSLREAGSLGLAGPRTRLLPLARAVLAQLTLLHPPSTLEVVVLASGRGRSVADWTWLGWLPHLRPAQGQDCRLLFGFDREQATARTEELVRRLEDGPLGSGWVTAEEAEIRAAATAYGGPMTVLVVDGDPGTAALRETVARLASSGSAGGVHVLCLAETAPTTATSPLADTLSAAYSTFPAFRGCGAVALLSGAVATAVRVVRRGDSPRGELATVDGVSAAWAERFARALAPAREPVGATTDNGRRPATALPPTARLLDELGLARATPAALLARWASVADGAGASGSVSLVLGAGQRGAVTADLARDRSHLFVSGGAGSGKTELLCSLAAGLAAGERPDRLGLVLIDGSGQGLRPCAELPHVATYLSAGDPVRMRELAQSLTAELKRRAELLAGLGYDAYVQRARGSGQADPLGAGVGQQTSGRTTVEGGAAQDVDRGTLRLRSDRPDRRGQSADREATPAVPPRIAVLVDDFDALVDPALGNPGRPAAGSVVRALEAIARDGTRLGVHLIAATGRPDRTAQTVTDQSAALRASIGGDPAADEHRPGRGVLHHPDGVVTPFQGARVTGRIPRTATTRPTVVPLDWARTGDPPSRRPVRELGNGPTDLALLASAVERAAREAGAAPPAPLSATD